MRGWALVAALFVLCQGSTAFAWTNTSDTRIASRAARLAPPDLRLLLDKYEADFNRGMKRASRSEDLGHLYIVERDRGGLKKAIDAEIAKAITLMRKDRQIRAFVERLGVIAHLMTDANNPFHVSDSDPRLRNVQTDFEKYFERRMESFPAVFYGLTINRDVPGYVDGVVDRTASFYPLLSEEYFRGGQRRSSRDFDDRSTAYGVASIAYSRSVTDIVNVYYYIWREAGGDVRTASVLRKGNLLINEPSSQSRPSLRLE